MSNFITAEPENSKTSAKTVTAYQSTKDSLKKPNDKDTATMQKKQRYNHWLQKARKSAPADTKNVGETSEFESSSAFEKREQKCDGNKTEKLVVGNEGKSITETEPRGSPMEHLRNENRTLRAALSSSKHEQAEMGKALDHLQSQLSALITHYKFLKSEKIVPEEKLGKSACTCGKADPEKLDESLESPFFEENKDKLGKAPRERSQSKSGTEESIDEGYADGSLLVCMNSTLPSPSPMDPAVLSTISGMLLESEDFLKPIEEGLNELKQKINNFQQDTFLQLDQLSLAADYGNERVDPFLENRYNSI